MSGNYVLDSYVAGPRWAGIGKFLRLLAVKHEIRLEKDHEKGLLRETVFFHAEGTEEQVAAFQEELLSTIESRGGNVDWKAKP
jgi:hypothetical protein